MSLKTIALGLIAFAAAQAVDAQTPAQVSPDYDLLRWFELPQICVATFDTPGTNGMHTVS